MGFRAFSWLLPIDILADLLKNVVPISSNNIPKNPTIGNRTGSSKYPSFANLSTQFSVPPKYGTCFSENLARFSENDLTAVDSSGLIRKIKRVYNL